MRVVFSAILILLLSSAAGRSQVINGEGTFESNGGFDRAPEDRPSTEKTAKPSDTESKRNAQETR